MPDKTPLYFRKEARLQIEHAADWFNEQHSGLGLKFLQEIDSTIRYIRNNPEKVQMRYKNVRIKFLKKFSFGLHYIYQENSIYILAVFHTSQSPQNWK